MQNRRILPNADSRTMRRHVGGLPIVVIQERGGNLIVHIHGKGAAEGHLPMVRGWIGEGNTEDHVHVPMRGGGHVHTLGREGGHILRREGHLSKLGREKDHLASQRRVGSHIRSLETGDHDLNLEITKGNYCYDITTLIIGPQIATVLNVALALALVLTSSNVLGVTLVLIAAGMEQIQLKIELT